MAETGHSANPQSRPHLVVIMTDQQRHDCLGVVGHPVLHTPHMDRVAEEGVCFTHAHTNSPLCLPVRVSLMKGQYPHNTHIWHPRSRLPADCENYVRALGRGGYRTCHIGKGHLFWHENTDLKAEAPYMHALGWEDLHETQGTWSSVQANSIYCDYLAQHGWLDTFNQYLLELDALPDEVRRFVAEPTPLPEEHVLDSFIGRTAVEHIESYADDRPMFMFVGFAGPHEPWDPPGRFAAMYDPHSCPEPIPEGERGPWLSDKSRRYDRWAQYFQPHDELGYQRIAAHYFGKISLIDEWVGRILAALEKRGWLENTVVVLTSDHGEALGDHARVSKSMFYESMVRVPLVVSGPGIVSARSEALVETIDLYPTLLDLAGCDSALLPDGVSLLPLLRGERRELRPGVLSEVHTHTMFRDRDWKLVVDGEGDTLQLFDLAHDPLEQVNLAGHPDYAQVELAGRSRLLERILATQHREGGGDPNESQHEPGMVAAWAAEGDTAEG